MKTGFFERILGNLFNSRIERIRNLYFPFNPVCDFGIAETFYKFPVIFMIIRCYEHSSFVKTVDKKPLFVEIAKSHRSLHFIHSKLFRPFFNSINKSLCNFKIFYNIKTGKPYAFSVPEAVETFIMYRKNTPHSSITAIRHKHFRVAIFISRIFSRCQIFAFIHKKARNITLVSYVKRIGKNNKFCYIPT